MKPTNLTREIILWGIILIPLVYLAVVWNELPERVPVHFNHKGEADGWSGKVAMIGIVVGTTALLNLLLLFIPRIDPKQKLAYMGSKYHQLRFILVIFMTAMSVFIVYNAQHQGPLKVHILFILMGAMIAALGNYFQAVKPNYFIGIRTPWTLESEQVWRKTHRMGGILWIIGGLVMIILALLPTSGIHRLVFIAIVVIMVLVPVIYSFIEYRKEQRLQRQA